MTTFADLLGELDTELSAVRERLSGAEYRQARTADAKLLFVLQNLNWRLERLEKYQEGRQ